MSKKILIKSITPNGLEAIRNYVQVTQINESQVGLSQKLNLVQRVMLRQAFNQSQSLLGISQIADLEKGIITLEFTRLLKLFEGQDVLGQVEDSVLKNLSLFGCSKDDFEVCYE